MAPIVSFVVPCYKLAHLLSDCVDSILGQTYREFEVLIMDDCSPDNTPEVARSFQDARVKYIRNATNLGHLRNYNKGIGLSQGKYVWLISADDYLRRAHILERYVNLLERNPRVGYTFCPGVAVKNGRETDILAYSVHGNRDRIMPGHFLLKRLLMGNGVLAASGMARRECYDRISLFPLNMPWAGDWYLWCVFALHFDVGYFAEPMVCYREHNLSMTNSLAQKSAAACCEEDVAVIWSIKNKADEATFRNASKECLDAVVQFYARNIASKRYGMSRPSLTLEEFEESLSRYCVIETDKARVRARVYAEVGNEYYWQGESALAKGFYESALKKNPWMLSTYVKRLLLSLGKRGDYLREAILSFRLTRNH